MSEGIKIPLVIPWTLVAAAALALTFMYRDVQHMKASMISVERIAKLETEVQELKGEDLELKESIRSLWRVRGGRPES